MNRDHDLAIARRPLVLGALLVAALAAAVALATATSGSSATAASAAACGVLPKVAPIDAQKTLAKATPTAQAYYNGWPFPLKKSSLANWKPKGKPPYTVGILFDGLSNPFQAYVFNLMQKFLNRAPSIDKVIGVVSEAGNPTKEVQNYQSLVQQGADVIIVQPSSAPAFLPVVKDALKQGVATIAYINPLSDASAVSVGPNVYTSLVRRSRHSLKLKGGKGNFLGVHGIRVTPVDKSTWTIYNSLLAACPDAKLVGEIDGNFAPPAVRAAVLQFLATYPGRSSGAFHTAVMGPSIIGAFQQAGRTVPSVIAWPPRRVISPTGRQREQGVPTDRVRRRPDRDHEPDHAGHAAPAGRPGPEDLGHPVAAAADHPGELQAVRQGRLDARRPRAPSSSHGRPTGRRRTSTRSSRIPSGRRAASSHGNLVGALASAGAPTGPYASRRAMSNPYSLSADSPGAAPYALRTVGLAKAFGPTQAVRSCTFDLRVGEVHAVMGENGSGKSTLVKMLTGVHQPDRGSIEVGGQELTGIRSPRAALDAGIVAVFQEVLVVGARSDPRQPVARHRPAAPRRGVAQRAPRACGGGTDGADGLGTRSRPACRGAFPQRPAGVLHRPSADSLTKDPHP